MTWAFAANITPGSDKTENQTTLSLTYTANVNDFVVFGIAIDNDATSDGSDPIISSISSTDGTKFNNWYNYCNARGSATNGITLQVIYGFAQSSNSNTITITLLNSSSRDASAWTGARFTKDITTFVTGSSTPYAEDSIDPFPMHVTSPNVETLRIRFVASESNDTTALTPSAFFTEIPGTNTSGGVSTTNVGIRMEWSIYTGANLLSDPTLYAATHVSVYTYFQETTATFPQYLSAIGVG